MNQPASPAFSENGLINVRLNSFARLLATAKTYWLWIIFIAYWLIGIPLVLGEEPGRLQSVIFLSLLFLYLFSFLSWPYAINRYIAPKIDGASHANISRLDIPYLVALAAIFLLMARLGFQPLPAKSTNDVPNVIAALIFFFVLITTQLTAAFRISKGRYSDFVTFILFWFLPFTASIIRSRYIRRYKTD